MPIASPTTLVNRVVNDLLYFVEYEGKVAIPWHWVKGRVPLFLVLGENAGGKSFFRRLIQILAQEAHYKEMIHLSMEARAGVNMMGAMKAFVYGDEQYRSTGENSAYTVTTAVKTCRGREHDHLLYWDEPDLGMSENAAAGAGIQIAKFMRKRPKHTRGVFVTTHSRALVEQLLPVKPHYLHLGVPSDEAPPSLRDWLDRPIVPISPEKVSDASQKRFKAIQKILNGVEQGERRQSKSKKKKAS